MPDNTVKLKLDAGFFKNGTEYQAAGRWWDGDLVRWHNGIPEPINGWQVKVDFLTFAPLPPLWLTAGEAARSGIALGDTLGGVNTYIGTNKKIYHISNTNVVDDVTPVGFVAKGQHSVSNTGYGAFRYSYGEYGTSRPAVAEPVPMVFSWGFTSWGDWPVACARADDSMRVQIKRTSDANFVPIAASPQGANDVLVTDQRFMMTFGTPADGKLIQWSDQENFDDWTPAIDNQAGSLRVAGTGRLIRGVNILNQILVVGENDAFSGQFVGPPYIYGFNRIGNSCGIIGPEAMVVTETFAAWYGARSFWMFDGTVKQLRCDVLDFLLEDADITQRSKTSAFAVSDYQECWWLYQSLESPTDEVDSYVIYNIALDRWYTGRLDRTTGMDSKPARNVVMVHPNGTVYDHEVIGAGHGGRIPYLISGPLELANGERCLGMSYVYPDDKLVGSMRMELQVRDMPNQVSLSPSEVRYSRDFELLRPTSTQGIMGRDVRMKLYSNTTGALWNVGDFRVVPVKHAGFMR